MEFEKENEEEIRDFSDKKLDYLKKCAYEGKVVKGIRQTIKAIVAGKVQEVFLCKNNSLGDKYDSVIRNYAKAYMGKEPIIISDFLILRDIVMNKYISNCGDIQKNKTGNNKIKGPKCFCAAIVLN